MKILSVMFGEEHEYHRSVQGRFEKCRRKLEEYHEMVLLGGAESGAASGGVAGAGAANAAANVSATPTGRARGNTASTAASTSLTPYDDRIGLESMQSPVAGT